MSNHIPDFINNYVYINIPALFNNAQPAVDPDVITKKLAEDNEMLLELNPGVDVRKTSLKAVASVMKQPNYLGRLLISARVTGSFINLNLGISRDIFDFEKRDIEKRFESANAKSKKEALAYLEQYKALV